MVKKEWESMARDRRPLLTAPDHCSDHTYQPCPAAAAAAPLQRQCDQSQGQITSPHSVYSGETFSESRQRGMAWCY